MNFHCPNCGRFVSNVYAEEYGELQAKDSWNPYFKWHVLGTCKTHGEIELKDHDGEDGCGCFSVNDWDCWWLDATDLDSEGAKSSESKALRTLAHAAPKEHPNV